MKGEGVRIRRIRELSTLVVSMLLLSGCAMFGDGLSSEQLSKMATVEGASGYPMHSVDAKTVLFTTSVNVEPGEHTFEITSTCYNNSCSYITYRFNAQAGNLYRLMPNHTIAVLDRNDQYQRKLDELTPVGSDGINYLNRKDLQEYAQGVVSLAQFERRALIERRKQNLIFVRKAGARICQVQGQVLYIGFVETYTDEKIQIRVASARMNDNSNYAPANFKPSIIWDSPLEWDLCE